MEAIAGFESIASAVYITCGVVWVLSILRCLALRRLGTEVDHARISPSPDNSLPSFSVIITAHNQCDELKRNLPLILNQIYPEFEVLVVDVSSNDGTQKFLEKMEEEYHQLRHTFTPPTSRDISTQRLAITLGVKASTHPWVVITQASCKPISHLWLRRLGESIARHRSAQMAIGYTRYKQPHNYTEWRMCFYHLWQNMTTFTLIPRHGAYRCDDTNLAYKKELFLSHQGFASHANLLMGATDIMVNQHSTQHNTTTCLHPESILERSFPSRKHWVQDRLYFEETRRHFNHTWHFRTRYVASIVLHALLVLAILATLTLSICMQHYFVTAAALLFTLTHIVVQGLMMNATSTALNDFSINHLRTAWFVHLLPFWHLRVYVQYIFGDKQKYRKKYI